MTLLRDRMAEDLRIRNYSPSTGECYVSVMERFTREFVEPPGLVGAMPGCLVHGDSVVAVGGHAFQAGGGGREVRAVNGIVGWVPVEFRVYEEAVE